ncbi:MAG: transposase, partial [Proteobacteria bacterium]|nr:transposase [Pseudomonadota bacterium]
MMKNAPGFDIFCACIGLGIDVSKASLELVGIENERVWRRELGNNESEIDALAQCLKTGRYQGKIVCESTGHYHLLLGLVFARYDLARMGRQVDRDALAGRPANMWRYFEMMP